MSLIFKTNLKNDAGTRSIGVSQTAVWLTRDRGFLAYQSSFGVAHNIVNAFAVDIIVRNSTCNNVCHPKATLIG